MNESNSTLICNEFKRIDGGFDEWYECIKGNKKVVVIMDKCQVNCSVYKAVSKNIKSYTGWHKTYNRYFADTEKSKCWAKAKEMLYK